MESKLQLAREKLQKWQREREGGEGGMQYFWGKNKQRQTNRNREIPYKTD